jgi:hypothetical protein
MQITQVSCYDTNLSPPGCTQYFYGGTTGTLNSFNYANAVQLASQAQHICIRLSSILCSGCIGILILLLNLVRKLDNLEDEKFCDSLKSRI